MLRSINIYTLRLKKKLNHRQLGLFKVLEKIGKQAYKLELPTRYSRIYPVFYILILES